MDKQQQRNWVGRGALAVKCVGLSLKPLICVVGDHRLALGALGGLRPAWGLGPAAVSRAVIRAGLPQPGTGCL
eukprot:COSAG01_NODE_1291_length_10881_cov_33.377017_11_plen_73_part_00